jgi:alanine racemase
MPDTEPAAEAGGLLTLDLAAIAANWRLLAERVAPAACAAVVKADAYGCGDARVAAALGHAGCRTFFVAHLDEGRRVRAAAPEAAIYVLNGLLPGTAALYAAHDLRPVLGSADEIAEWSVFRSAASWAGGAALHVDTGMNRLGVPFGDAPEVRDAANTAGIVLLMSHLACADQPEHPLNAMQIDRFRAVRALFPGIPGSLANSPGIFLGDHAHHDLVRPGIALYGGNPTPHQSNPMHSVVALHGRVAQVRAVPVGETVGYGATWTARRPSRIAVVSIGYADGFMRSAGPPGPALAAEAVVAGQRCPVAGRISMDLLALDVTDVPSPAPRRGDWVALLDDTIGVDELADRAGTISYEVLTALGRRYSRVYRER